MPNSTDSRNPSTLSQQGYPKLVRFVLQNLWVISHQQQRPGEGAFRLLHADNWLWFLKLSFWCGSNLGWLLGVTKADCYNRQVGLVTQKTTSIPASPWPWPREEAHRDSWGLWDPTGDTSGGTWAPGSQIADMRKCPKPGSAAAGAEGGIKQP